MFLCTQVKILCKVILNRMDENPLKVCCLPIWKILYRTYIKFNQYTCFKCQVWHQGAFSGSFYIISDVRQGCILTWTNNLQSNPKKRFSGQTVKTKSMIFIASSGRFIINEQPINNVNRFPNFFQYRIPGSLCKPLPA